MLYMYLDFLKAVSPELLAYCIESNAQQCPPFYPSEYEDLANALLTKKYTNDTNRHQHRQYRTLLLLPCYSYSISPLRVNKHDVHFKIIKMYVLKF